jgi:hypothetical protein
MDGWYGWFRVLVIFLVGLGIVMILVRLVIKWADRADAKEERIPIIGPISEPEKPKIWTEQVAPREDPPEK